LIEGFSIEFAKTNKIGVLMKCMRNLLRQVTVPEFVSFEVAIVMLLRAQIFWDVMLCCRMNDFQHFEESYCFHLQGQAIFYGLLYPEDGDSIILQNVRNQWRRYCYTPEVKNCQTWSFLDLWLTFILSWVNFQHL